MGYEYETYGDLRVAWTAQLDGGGRGFGQQIVPVVRRLVGKVDRVFELCAGPGFMGFSLLAHGLCKSVCLSDVNPAAIAAVKETIAVNGLHDSVSVYLSDALDAIPDSERWDLVVSNPPHFERPQRDGWDLISGDPAWSIHKRFYSQVRRHLTPNGQCFLQENYAGSCERTFMPFLRRSGLEYVGSLMLTGHHGAPLAETHAPPLNSIYFFITRVKHDGFLWAGSAPTTSVEVAIEDADYVVSVDQRRAATTPLTLPIGRKYRIALSNHRRRPAAFTISWDSGSVPFEIAAASVLTNRPVFVPTAPTRIAEDSSGQVVIAFE